MEKPKISIAPKIKKQMKSWGSNRLISCYRSSYQSMPENHLAKEMVDAALDELRARPEIEKLRAYRTLWDDIRQARLTGNTDDLQQYLERQDYFYDRVFHAGVNL